MFNVFKNEKTEDSLNFLIIILCLLQVAILRWLRLSIYSALAFDALVCAHILLFWKKYNKLSLVLFALIPFYFIFSFLILGGSLRNVIANLRDVFSTILIIPFSIYLINNKKDILKRLREKLLIPTNIFFFINIIFIQLQKMGYTNLSGFTYEKNFTYRFLGDSLSGLMGLYGVPLLALFYVFMVLLNAQNYLNNSVKYKKIFLVYNLIAFVYTLYISKINDNKLYYPLVAVFAFLFILMNINNRKLEKKYKTGIYISFIILTFISVIAFIKIPYVNAACKSMLGALKTALDYKNAYQNGSGERIAIILYFLNELNLAFGCGVGAGRWTESMFLGYRHFGINDLSSILSLGGFVLFGIDMLCFYNLFKQMYKSKIYVVSLALVTIFVMFLTQIFISFSGIILYIGMCMLLNQNNGELFIKRKALYN